MELLEARAVLVEEEAVRAVVLEEGTGAREASLRPCKRRRVHGTLYQLLHQQSHGSSTNTV